MRRPLSILFLACLLPALAEPTAPSPAPKPDAVLESVPAPDLDWTKAASFWSFRPPVRHPLPSVRQTDWPAQPLDHFVLARLERRGLSPSPAADRRVLLRRVTFDLTGLPPTPDDMDRFLADPAPDAYARVVERLLHSPRFGERLASFWLPLARYAEDQAHQVGNDTTMFYPNAYRYREWVIEAFNRDLPYDRFIRLQLAADLLPDGAGDLAALGFLGLGPKYYNRNRLDVQADEWEDRVDTVSRTVLGLSVACARCHDHKFDPIPTRDYYALAGVFASTRMVNKAPDGRIVDGKVSADRMPPGTLHMVEDGDPTDLNVFVRGRVDRKGPVVERAFLSVLGAGQPARLTTGETAGSGRRPLADALVSRDGPLAARVLVNRLWGQLFGRPLVMTPSNFGHTGMAPSHPELLDDLAVRFMDGGWSIRSLVREFVLSSAYRQDSRSRPDADAGDPANELLSRMNRRRLSVEQWRDTALFVSGQLTATDGRSQSLEDPDHRTRTVYTRISRLQLDELLMLFDYPDANIHAERRSVTTTATQKLYLLNHPFVLRAAGAMARRIQDEVKVTPARPAPGSPPPPPSASAARSREPSAPTTTSAAAASEPSPTAWLEHAWRLAYQRLPTPDETAALHDFLSVPTTESMSAWEQLAQVLLTSNETLYLD